MKKLIELGDLYGYFWTKDYYSWKIESVERITKEQILTHRFKKSNNMAFLYVCECGVTCDVSYKGAYVQDMENGTLAKPECRFSKEDYMIKDIIE